MKKRKYYSQIIKFTLFTCCGILGTQLSATEFKNIEITNYLKYDIELHLKESQDDDEDSDNNENDEQINADDENSFHYATIKAGQVDQSMKVALELTKTFKHNKSTSVQNIDFLPEDYDLVFEPNKQKNPNLHFNFHEIKVTSDITPDSPYYEEIAVIEGCKFIGKIGIVFSTNKGETLKITIDSQDPGLKPPSASWNPFN